MLSNQRGSAWLAEWKISKVAHLVVSENCTPRLKASCQFFLSSSISATNNVDGEDLQGALIAASSLRCFSSAEVVGRGVGWSGLPSETPPNRRLQEKHQICYLINREALVLPL